MHLGFLAKLYLIFFAGFVTAILLTLFLAICFYLIYLIRNYPQPIEPGMHRVISQEVLIADSMTSSVIRNEGKGRISPKNPDPVLQHQPKNNDPNDVYLNNHFDAP